MARGERSLWDRIWRDRNGKVVIWQTPNAWLIGWAVLTTISLFLSGANSDIFSVLGEVSLIIWALLEMAKGVNYFRRFLGLLGLAAAIAIILNNF